MKRRITSLVLTASLVIGFFPGIAPAAMAADQQDSQSIGTTAEKTLDNLGFTTGGQARAEIEKALDGAGKATGEKILPYGESPISMNTISELFITEPNNTYLYDADNKQIVFSGVKGNAVNGGTKAGNSVGFAMRSDSLDLDGDGKAEAVAQVYVHHNQTTVMLRVEDAKTKTELAKKTICEDLSFEITLLAAGAHISVATGDFDGDNLDEIAVNNPKTGMVEIYKFVDGTLKNVNTINYLSHVGQADGDGDKMRFDLSDSYRTQFPVVDLTTVKQSQDLNETDDLVIAVSHARRNRYLEQKGDDAANGSNPASRILVYTNPISAPNSYSRHKMSWSWESYGIPIGDADDRYETMMFAGVSAGDITGDGAENVAISGYRLTANKEDGWNLTDSEYLFTYLNYQQATDSYTLAQKGQWIGIKTDDFQNVQLEDGFNNNNTPNDNVLNPLVTECFSARGMGFSQSVFVNGIVLVKADQTSTGYANYPSMGGSAYPSYSGYPDKLFKNCAAEFSGTGFFAQYSAPLMLLDDKASNPDNRLVMEAHGGNFDANKNGMEQIAFTYVLKKSGSDRFTTMFGIFKQDKPGDVPQNEIKKGQAESAYSSFNNRTYQENQRIRAGEIASLSFAPVDVDNDSYLLRYSGEQEAAFYFSDPEVMAVLQAYPYFDELEYESSAGGTAITKSKTSGTTHTEEIGATIKAGLGVDFEVVKILGTVSVSSGYQYENSVSTTKSISFSTEGGDSVVLSMVPYIRYDYECFDPQVGTWQKCPIDIPLTLQTSVIDVSIYDQVAQENGWQQIRGSVLTSVPGDPSSYAKSAPSGWVSAQKDSIGVGAGTGAAGMSIEKEEETAKGVFWGVSAGVEVEGGALVAFKVEASADYSGSYSWSTGNGTSYEGEVPNVPTDMAAQYGFTWNFGASKVKFDKGAEDGKIVLLSYTVENVRQLPKKVTSLSVKNATDTSLTLSWAQSDNADYYVLYRYNENTGSYYPIVTLEADESEEYLTYIEQGLQPNTNYHYAVRAFEYIAGTLAGSQYSPVVVGHTNPAGDLAAKILQQPQDTSVRAGKNAEFSIGVQGSAGKFQYQWQTFAGGKWQNIKDATASTLTLHAVTQAEDQTEYRCIVTQMVSGTLYDTFSNAATLSVGRSDTTTTLSLSSESGAVGKAQAIAGTEKEIMSEMTVIFGEKTYSVLEQDGSYYLASEGNYYTMVAADQAAVAAACADFAQGGGQIYAPITLSAAPVAVVASQTCKVGEQTYTIGAETAIVPTAATVTIDDIVYQTSCLSLESYDVGNGNYLHYLTAYADATKQEEMETRICLGKAGTENGEAWTNVSSDSFSAVYLTSGGTEIKPAEMETVSVVTGMTLPEYTVTSGAQVTLSATVADNAATDRVSPTGNVTFVITNLDTGIRAILTGSVKNAAASAVWTPTEAGRYEIVAQYSGDGSLLPSKSQAKEYLATAQVYLLIAGAAEGKVQQEIALSTAIMENGAKTDVTAQLSVDASQSQYTISGQNIAFHEEGSYIITATTVHNGAVLVATKKIEISRYQITFSPIDQEASVESGGTFDGAVSNDTVSMQASAGGELSSLPAFLQLHLDLPYQQDAQAQLQSGAYPIYLTLDKGNSQLEAFEKKYEITLEEGLFTLGQARYRVVYSAQTNGAVSVSAENMELSSGTKLNKDSVVKLTAIPDEGYCVKEWTYRMGDAEETASGNALTLTLSADAEVTVSFEPDRYTLTYSSEDQAQGTVSAAYADETPILSGEIISKLKQVTLTAAPAQGYSVKAWTINGETVKNEDGTDNNRSTLSLQDVQQGSVEIVVSFEQTETYTVDFSAIDADGQPILKSNLTGGGTYEKGDDITLTAPTTGGEMISQWRRYTSDTEYTVLQGNKPTYQISNIREDYVIKVVYDQVSTHSLTYEITMPSGDTETTLDVTSEDTALESGKSYPNGTVVTLDIAPQRGSYLASIVINGQAQQFTLLEQSEACQFTFSLTADTTVSVLVEEITPAISFAYALSDDTKGDISAQVDRKNMPQYHLEDTTGSVTVYQDGNVSITAVPDSGYRVASWYLKEGDGTPVAIDPNRRGITISGNSITLLVKNLETDDGFNFNPEKTYTVIANLAQQGSDISWQAGTGGIISAAEHSVIGAVTSPVTLSGGTIEFMAQVQPGYEFDGWYLDDVMQAETLAFSYTVTQGVGANIQARFTLCQYALSFAGENGEVTAKAEGITLTSGEDIAAFTEVSFLAQADAGYVFSKWLVNGKAHEETGETLTLEMTGDTQVTAQFVAGKYTFTYENGDHGTVTADKKNGATLGAGTSVVVTAKPETGYMVDYWQNNGEKIADSDGLLSLTHVITESAHLSPVYKQTQMVTITIEVAGDGQVLCGDEAVSTISVVAHSDVTLTAQAHPGNYFVAWSDESTSATRTLSNVTEDITLGVTFAFVAKYNVLVSVGAHGTLESVTGGYDGEDFTFGDYTTELKTGLPASVTVNQYLKVCVTPEEGYMVDTWFVDGVAVDGHVASNLVYGPHTKAGEISVTFKQAVFIPLPTSGTNYTLTNLEKTPDNVGTAAQVAQGGSVSFTLVPPEDKIFETLVINGVNCEDGYQSSGETENVLSVTKNADGSYTVSVTNITQEITIAEPSLLSAYTVTITQSTGGTITVSTAGQAKIENGTKIPQGTEITITASAKSGYKWKETTVNAVSLTGNTYLVTEDVVITALFEKQQAGGGGGLGGGTSGGGIPGGENVITLPDEQEGGSITVDTKNPEKGDTVVIVPDLDPDFVLDDLVITDENGNVITVIPNEDGTYTFVYEDGLVIIDANIVPLSAFECSGGITCPSYHLTDVHTNQWYHSYIDFVVAGGMMQGVSKNQFAPEQTLTRSMFAQILYQIEGKPQVNKTFFSDVAQDAWYADAVNWCAQEGIVSGVGDGKFAPEDTLTREQMAQILYQYCAYKDIALEKKQNATPADINEVSIWAKDAVAAIYQAEILSGKGSGIFDPKSTATRAEMAAMMTSFLKTIAPQP